MLFCALILVMYKKFKWQLGDFFRFTWPSFGIANWKYFLLALPENLGLAYFCTAFLCSCFFFSYDNPSWLIFGTCSRIPPIELRCLRKLWGFIFRSISLWEESFWIPLNVDNSNQAWDCWMTWSKVLTKCDGQFNKSILTVFLKIAISVLIQRCRLLCNIKPQRWWDFLFSVMNVARSIVICQ